LATITIGAPLATHAVDRPAARARIAKADLGFVIVVATKDPAISGSKAICGATAVLETGISR
jgi:proline racemase